MCFSNWDGGWAVIPCLLLWWRCQMSSASRYQRSIWVMTRIMVLTIIFMVSKVMFALVPQVVVTLLGVFDLWVLMLQIWVLIKGWSIIMWAWRDGIIRCLYPLDIARYWMVEVCDYVHPCDHNWVEVIMHAVMALSIKCFHPLGVKVFYMAYEEEHDYWL